jgi:hypothetical protein
MSVQTNALEGIDLINCRCLAPLLLHFKREAGIGILMSVPDNKGLLDTTFIPSYSALSKNDLSFLYLSANTSGIMILV